MAMTNINDEVRWEAFCKRLMELTERGAIKWSDWSDHIDRDDADSPLFVAKYKNWHLLIYRYSYKHWIDEDEFHWTKDVTIELIDDDHRLLWRLPKVPGRHQLLDYVEYKNADVQSLLDDVMSSDDDD